MKNLKAAIKRELKAELKKDFEGLKEFKSIEELKKLWYYRNLIPVSSKNREFKNVSEFKNYLKNRMQKKHDKALKQKFERVETVLNAQEVESIVLTVVWKKNSTWGSNPTATAEAKLKNGLKHTFSSGSISGCGYDKQSTAVANALNQCNGLLKKLYKKKNANSRMKNGDLFGYGSGYGFLPSFEGGVGVNCYNSILNKIGLKLETITSNKDLDVYKVVKK